jgi:hypothetical protein
MCSPHCVSITIDFRNEVTYFQAGGRWQGLCRMCDGLSPFPGLSARPQGYVSRRWVPDPPLPLKVYLPTIVHGRVLWHLGYTEDASAAALTQSYGVFQRAAVQHEPLYRVKGVLTDGFDSTTKSTRTLFPGARLGTCLHHALNKHPKKLVAIPSPVRKVLRSKFHTL